MSESSKSSSEFLLTRLDANIRMVHTQLGLLEIAISNLKGSWFAVMQDYKIFKNETEEEI